MVAIDELVTINEMESMSQSVHGELWTPINTVEWHFELTKVLRPMARNPITELYSAVK